MPKSPLSGPASGLLVVLCVGGGALACGGRPMEPVGYTPPAKWDTSEARGQGHRPRPPPEERDPSEPIPLLGSVRRQGDDAADGASEERGDDSEPDSDLAGSDSDDEVPFEGVEEGEAYEGLDGAETEDADEGEDVEDEGEDVEDEGEDEDMGDEASE